MCLLGGQIRAVAAQQVAAVERIQSGIAYSGFGSMSRLTTIVFSGLRLPCTHLGHNRLHFLIGLLKQVALARARASSIRCSSLSYSARCRGPFDV